MPEILEGDEFSHGVYIAARFSWEYSSHNRGEAPDTDEIIKEILDEISEEELLAEEYYSSKEP